jgi:squalene-associated FAD-dependent desaturase
MSSKSVIVMGGGLAGLSSAVALAEAGFRVRLLEQRPFLGGRASSYLLPKGEQGSDHVDNCQHVTLGCCTNLDDFYRRVGAAGKITYYDSLTFVDAHGRRSALTGSSLPVPLHLTASLLLYSALSWSDRQSVGNAMLAVAALGGKNEKAAGRSMLDWLRAHGQSAAALQRFWSVILVSALNDELDRIDARYGLDVFWKAFLANRAGSLLGLPSVPLSDLYDGCRAAIERRGGEVVLRSTVRALPIENGRLAGVDLDNGSREVADYYLLAVPHGPALQLLPPQLIAADPILGNLHRLRASPITGVHFWFDRDVMGEPFLVLVDRTTQWIFNKSRLYGGPGDGRYLQLVISASYALVQKSRQEIIDLCLDELREVLPAVREATLTRATVIKELSATFSPEPGSDDWRPPQRTSLDNFFLAGDWTATGWPATMEGAVRSGYLAAEAILAASGAPKTQILRPDLPVEGLSRWFAAHPAKS